MSEPNFEQLRERFHDHEENYNLLRGDKQQYRERVNEWDTDQVLEKYVTATDRMIGILDGSITEHDITDSRDPERAADAPDTVVYLDKSARPVSWFVDAFWEQMANENAKKPADEYLNIDRAVWFMRQGHNSHDAERTLGPNDFDINKVPEEDLARIRALFIDEDIDQDNWETDVWNHPTRIDNQNVLVVDEVKNRGGTLSIATQLIRKAVPEAIVNGDYYWKAGRYSLGNGGDMQMDSAPVWYRKEDVWGRGVGDISKSYYEQLPDTPDNFKKKLGWIVLSAPHHDPRTFEELPDVKADRLKQDIAYATYGHADGRILSVPARERDFDDMVDKYAQRYPDLRPVDITKYKEHRANQKKR